MVRIRIPKNSQKQSSVIDVRYTYGPPVPQMSDNRNRLMDSLWCMSYYFNPQGFKTRYDNFLLFYQRLISQTQNLMIFEVALKEEDFVLQNICMEDRLVQIVDTSLIWQKERLFNNGLKLLPPQCTKVVWVDCDILFDNNEWVYETSNMLDHYVVVQPYYQNARLPQSISCIDHGIMIESFYYGYGDEQRADGDIHGLFKSKNGMSYCGHPGYAYGYQRKLLETHGLYDRCITGSSDTLTSQAVIGTHNESKIVLDYYNQKCLDHYLKWAYAFNFDVGLSINFCRKSHVYHLYHGQTKHRKYFGRLKFLKEIDFDYSSDIDINDSNGCYKLKKADKRIDKWLSQYYFDRSDDE